MAALRSFALSFGSVFLVLLSPVLAWAVPPSLDGQSANDVVARSLAVDNENSRLASKYLYQENDLTRERDSSGKLKSTKSEAFEVLYIGEKEYQRRIEKDGKPLPDGEAKKEQSKIDKATAEASRLSPEERAKRVAAREKDDAKQRERLKPIPNAFDFKMLAEQKLGDRPVYVIQADPKSSYRGKFDNLFRNVKAKIYIDKGDLEWVRVEAEVLNDISFGLFLAKVSKGSRVTFEQTRVNDEVWLPKTVSIKASARALIKHVNIEQEIVFSNFRKFQTDSRIVSTDEVVK